MRLSCLGENEARIYECGVVQGWSELAGLSVPIAVAGGRIDGGDDVPALLAPRIAEALVRGTFISFPELTHFGPMEDPRAVATAIEHFFDSLGL